MTRKSMQILSNEEVEEVYRGVYISYHNTDVMKYLGAIHSGDMYSIRDYDILMYDGCIIAYVDRYGNMYDYSRKLDYTGNKVQLMIAAFFRKRARKNFNKGIAMYGRKFVWRELKC